jgi:hypothetical protein
VNLRIAAVVLLALLAQASAAPPARATSPDLREPTVYFSILDAIEQSLSKQVNGDNLHSHQIAYFQRVGWTPAEVMKTTSDYVHGGLCSPSQSKEDWSQLRCRSYASLNSELAPCSGVPQCIRLKLAPFVVQDDKLMAAVVAAVVNPCKQIPSQAELVKRHGKNARGPATMHMAATSAHWLSCDTATPVVGTIERAADGDFFIRYGTTAGQ